MSTEAAASTQSAEAGRFQTDRVVTITFGHAVHDTYTAFLPPLLPVFIETLSLTRTEAGFLTVFMQAPSLLQPFIGHLADRLSLRWFVIVAPAVAGVVMSLLGVAPSYGVLALLLTVAGLNSATLHAVAPVMAGRVSGKNLGRGMGFWMVGGELGRTFGPLLVGISLEFLTLERMPWLMVGGLVASAALSIRLKDVPGRPPSAAEGLPWRQVLRVMGPFLVVLTGIVIVRAFMVVSLTTYLPVFLSDEGAELWFAAISLSILEIAGVAGALAGGALSDRWGRRVILAMSLLTTPLLMFAFLAAEGWPRFPLLALLGFTSLSVTPVIMALVQESFPENRAMANGVYMSLNFVIRAGVVVVLGRLGDLFGMGTAFAASAVLTFFGLPLVLLLPGKKR
jgi:FSR family fosmidomycin resistance protein-like MFS transporter